jgi:oxalate---CoA ligase
MDSAWKPPGETVPACIAWWARSTPDSPALLGLRGEEFSYAQLWAFMERFRRDLAASGVARGERVVLATPDGVLQAAVMLAAMRAAVATTVNPALPLPEAEAILTGIGPGAVIVPPGTRTTFREAANAAGVPVLEVDESGTLHPGSSAPNRGVVSGAEPAPDDLAMILLTSGTTERSRRVPISHEALLDVCALRVAIRELSRSDRGLHAAPGSFVVGISRTVESIISGGSAIVAAPADVVAFPEVIRALAPTWAWFGPALIESIIAAAETNDAFREWPLRMVRSGGARLRPELAARAEELWGVPVLTGYGTTETIGFIAAEEHVDRIPRRPGSVGQIRPDLDVSIRSEAGEALPHGATGEITVRTGHRFAGYLDDPEASAAAFFPGGWYRTGDLGRLDTDGYLFVTGRVREMINRGGEKIAPHEIDDLLRAHPAVADAAAFALPDPRLGEEVAAAVVLRDGEAVKPRELRAWVAGRLAPHKIPRKIWFVPALPRTASGKVQRADLAARFRGGGG